MSLEAESNSATQPLLRVYEGERLVFSIPLGEGLLVGRQSRGEPPPFCQIDHPTGPHRVIVAAIEETSISRQHLRLDPVDSGVTLTNLSQTRPVYRDGGSPMAPGEEATLELPVSLMLGGRVLRIEMGLPGAMQASALLQSLPQTTWAPGSGGWNPPLPQAVEADDEALKIVLRWLQHAMAVFLKAASAPDFFEQAARTTLDLVGLDSVAVLLLEDGTWQVECRVHARGGRDHDEWRPSQTILERVRHERRTYRQLPPEIVSAAHSLMGVTALVAAPILDPRGEVIGIIYGDRHRPLLQAGLPAISELEAVSVELLACGVAAGLARLEQERAALEARVQFEQFFTPRLASELAQNPNLLEGRDAEVTVVFADIRNFSGISQQLGPAKTVEWINRVLTELSQCVLQEEGVLVDYIGDQLLAMFGAPTDQPDHAQRACRSALAMLRKLPELNALWAERLGQTMGLGIGINSGLARVGNVGSTQKFKYGALGNTVNLGSRVEGATKYLGTSLLVTQATHQQLRQPLPSRRVGAVRVLNIAGAVDLYELADPAVASEFAERATIYEQALIAFEGGHLESALAGLTPLLTEPPDPPAAVLAQRIAQVQAGQPHDPVWELPGK